MFAKYSENPEEWSVSKLATAYGVSQPRVQAILLLKTWEKQDEENGVSSELGNQLENMVRKLRTQISYLLLYFQPCLYAHIIMCGVNFSGTYCSFKNSATDRGRK